MRVALCTFAFPEFTVCLAKALSAHCDVTVFFPKHVAIADDCFKSIRRFSYHPEASSAQKLKACLEMIRQVRAFGPHIVHLQGSTPYLVPFLPLIRHVPLIKTLHDPLPHSGEEQWAHRVTKILLTKLALRVIVLAEAMRGISLAAYPWLAGKLTVIPHGTYGCYCEGRACRPTWLPSDKKYILFFGRVSKYKGVEDLLEAFDQVSNRELNLVIAGKQLYPLSVPETIKARVLLADEFISNDVLRYLFRHCELVALPYRDATQSGVLMMAYAFARPIIATNVGGFPEMVRDGETGRLVPPGAPKELAAAIETYLDDPVLAEDMGRRGACWSEEHFSWERIARQTFETYRGSLRGKALGLSCPSLHDSAPSN